VPLTSLVVEIPAYRPGPQPPGIAFVARHLAGLLQLPLAMEDLRLLSEAKRTDQRGHREHRRPRPADPPARDDYDNDVFDTQLDDLKDWLDQPGHPPGLSTVAGSRPPRGR